MNDLGSGTENVKTFVLNPTFEEAIGVPRDYAEGRRRVHKFDAKLLRERVREADVRAVAGKDSNIESLLVELGLVDPGKSHGGAA